MVAASRGDYASTLRLLSESDVNARDAVGNTALIYAAAGGHAEVLRLLLRAGANASLRNGAALSALDRAKGSGRRDAVELLAAADEAARAEVLTESDSRLLKASLGGDAASVASLLSRGASSDARSPGTRWTPLMCACASVSVETARALLDNGARVDDVAADGRMALHVSAQAGDVELIRLLLSRGADPARRDHYGETPRACAERGGAPVEALALLDAGAVIPSGET
jgi:ankyrin repeat protein